MHDQDLKFLLENIVSAKKMARDLHVTEEIIEELCEEGNLNAKRLNNEWAILKNQELPCLNFLQFEKVVKNLPTVMQDFNNSYESLQISLNVETFELIVDKFENRLPSDDFTEILYKNKGVKNVLNQTILLIRCYEMYLAEKTDWDLITALTLDTTRKKWEKIKLEYNDYYSDYYDFVDLEGVEYWPYKLIEDPNYLTIQGVWIDKVIFEDERDLITKYVVEFEINFNVTPWAKPLDNILHEVNIGASELDAIGFVAIFDSKDEAWDYARKLFPEIDLTQAITEKYYSKFPEDKANIE